MKPRIQELKSKGLHHGLDEDEEAELEQLLDANRQAQLAALPFPTCCEAAKTHRTVYLSVSEEKPVKAAWRPSFIDMNGDPNTRDFAWYDGVPEASFCVFCGAKLPEMVRKAEPPKPLCVYDGGHYCVTCRERLNCCTCLPPSAAFEPKAS